MTPAEESPLVSERSLLLLDAANGGDQRQRQQASLELGSPSETAPELRSFPSHRLALLGFLALGITLRLFGFAGGAALAPRHHNDNASLSSPSSYWNDERYHAWEVYLEGKDSRSTLGAAASLLAPSTPRVNEVVLTHDKAETGGLVYFNQTSAFARLTPDDDFFRYQQGWEAQITQALCAIATTAAMINSLRGPGFDLPLDPVYRPYHWATQSRVLGAAADNPCVVEALGGSIHNADAVYHIGLGLTMVPRLANCFLEENGYRATGHPADPSDETASSRMKQRVVKALGDPSSRVLLNYQRAGIGQTGGGHWSPLGGYHEATDSFLVMDVAKYKFPMVWVSWENLWSGAATEDSCGEMLSLGNVDWDAPFDQLREYVATRCLAGHRGFVLVEAEK